HATQNQSLLAAMLLSMPAAAALIAMAEPIVRVLFERGAFDALATAQTAHALIAFSTGLPAYVLIRVLQPGFFAREDTVTPTIFAGISVLANIVLSLLLFPSLVHIGIAIATAASSWLNAVLLALFLARRGHFALSGAEWRRHGLILFISAIMGASLYLLADQGRAYLASSAPFWQQAGVLAVLVGFGLVLYFTLVHVSRVQPLGQLFSQLRRRR
ncbi:murein biosynthesis integral membrane protein MurJ, partial [Devosia sp.]|uniref:murein biosynthesis integral membrane protein MurJ n=1 Tax=Devosia sp. TaxID=1871048 RepID=UPI002AFDDB0E